MNRVTWTVGCGVWGAVAGNFYWDLTGASLGGIGGLVGGCGIATTHPYARRFGFALGAISATVAVMNQREKIESDAWNRKWNHWHNHCLDICDQFRLDEIIGDEEAFYKPEPTRTVDEATHQAYTKQAVDECGHKILGYPLAGMMTTAFTIKLLRVLLT